MFEFSTRRFFVAVLAAAVVAGLPGCGPGYEIAEVEGVVKVDGKPLSRAAVEFHPDPDAGTHGPYSVAETDEDGRYTLRYAIPAKAAAGRKDGVVVGKHKVLVLDLWAATDAGAGRLRFASDYTQLATTPLTREVRPGKQTIDLELSAK